MEGDGLGLHLALLNIDLVSAQNDGNVLADTDEITYVGCQLRCAIEQASVGPEEGGIQDVRCQLGTFL